MADPIEIVKRYFQALHDHDLDAAGSVWAKSGRDRFVGQQEVAGPAGVRTYFKELFDAFPDFSLEVLELVPANDMGTVSWRTRGTLAGFQGFERGAIEGCGGHADPVIGDVVAQLQPAAAAAPA